jgi:hypothetical protein
MLLRICRYNKKMKCVKMKVRRSIILLGSVLIAALASPGQGQNQPPQQSPLPKPLTAASNNENLKKELFRVQMELNQIAQDLDAIDTRIMLGITNKALSGTSKIISEVHELLKAHSTGQAIKVFFDSPRNDIKWESCLKTAKLYRSLFEKIFEISQERMPGSEKNPSASSISDESPEVVQLVFLARMMTELELRYSQLQFQLMISPGAKRPELWRQLREALQNDDRTYMEKWNALGAKTGVSPNQFAAKVISDAQKTSETAATAVVEGMGIVNPEGDVWRLADIPGINSDFVRALECDRRAMKDFLATASNAALVQVCSCRNYADGSSVLAFAAKPAGQVKSPDLVGKTQLTLGGIPLDSGAVRLSREDLSHQTLSPDQGDTKAGAEHRQGESENTTFGVTNLAVPRPKIPSWWIRCACPEDHPNAGMVVDGVRWHAPVLQCPNPELRLRELLKSTSPD